MTHFVNRDLPRPCHLVTQLRRKLRETKKKAEEAAAAKKKAEEEAKRKEEKEDVERVEILAEPSKGLAQAFLTETVPEGKKDHHDLANLDVKLEPPNHPRGLQSKQLPIVILSREANGSIQLEVTVDIPLREKGGLEDDALFDPLQYGNWTVNVNFSWGAKSFNLSIVPPDTIRPAQEYLAQDALTGEAIKGIASISLE